MSIPARYSTISKMLYTHTLLLLPVHCLSVKPNVDVVGRTAVAVVTFKFKSGFCVYSLTGV